MSKLYIINTLIWSRSSDIKYTVLNYYRPQNGKTIPHSLNGSNISLLTSYLSELVNNNKYNKYPLIFGGDANVHHSDWMDNESHNSKAKKQGIILNDWMTLNGFNILNNGESTRIVPSSHQYTTPDISFTCSKTDSHDCEWWTEDFGTGK
eukprot:497970_1